ncbi:MAG: hypothetical protein IJ405_00405 [Lachnospiraceae bacterium]|nr:hypothetical protein [Lachnospiraceae bacterium]
MFSYTITEWLFFFYFYCFFGWCFESAYVSLRNRKLINRGFMRGPFLPLYGSGALMMLLVSRPFTEHWWAVYVAGCIGATILEYVTGVVMEALFKVRYWDYSDQKFNVKGYICLSSSLAWGGLTLLMCYVLHQPVENLMQMIPKGILYVLVLGLTVYIVSDFSLAFKAALDFKEVLLYMDKAKDELARMQKRLDVVIAVAEDEWNTRKEAIEESIEKSKEAIEQRKASVKDGVEIWAEKLEQKKEAVYTEYLLKKKQKSISKRLWNNPSMRSVKYKDALEELKKKVVERKR